MFLRRKSKSARGVGYSHWHLCETVRTARGPRQRIVASLGKLDEAEVAGWRGGWEDLPALLRGEAPPPRAVTASLPGFADHASGTADAAPRWEQADLRALRVERSRDFGECYLALSLWHRLGLDVLLADLLPAGRESVGWAHVAALLTVARFCAQRSELGVAEPGGGDVGGLIRHPPGVRFRAAGDGRYFDRSAPAQDACQEPSRRHWPPVVTQVSITHPTRHVEIHRALRFSCPPPRL